MSIEKSVAPIVIPIISTINDDIIASNNVKHIYLRLLGTA